MSDYPEIKEFFEKATPDILEDLAKLVSIKSRSDDRKECEEALDFVLGRAEEMGLKSIKGRYGDAGIVTLGDGTETIGVLVHVDVVPEGNVRNWDTDPFELTMADGHLYGRGVVDDKGPVIASLYAMKYLKDKGIPLTKKIMLIVGTMEEIVWKDMDHFKEEFPLPDYGFSPDGAFPIYNKENGYIDIELIFKEDLLTGDEGIHGGSARNSIPAEAVCTFNGETLTYKGKNAHSSAPYLGKNAISLMCEDLAERTDLGFAKFIARYFPEKSYCSNLSFSMKDGSLSGEDDIVMVPTMISQEGKAVTVNINVRNDYALPTKSVLDCIEEKKAEGKYDTRIIEILESIWVDEDLPWIRRMKNVLEEHGIKPECRFAPGCSYAKSIPNTVCYGPKFEDDRDCAHMDNEGQSLKNFIFSAELYAQYLAGEMI